MEAASRKRRQRDNIQQTVLAIIGVAGVLATVAVAPGVFAALPTVMGKERYKLSFKAKSAVHRLMSKGMIVRNSDGHLEITEKGRRRLDIERARTSTAAFKKRKWDKRYRLVMFDIPQKRRTTRDKLRHLMRDFGFLRLQDSVWVSPYDCEELIALVKAELRVGKIFCTRSSTK